MNKKILIGAVVAIILIITGICIITHRKSVPAVSTPGPKIIYVVAAENFWGSLISQIGGSRVEVLSIVTDPNTDPHEYESNTTNARAVSNADYVIVNGAGYDSWVDKLLSAGGKPNRKVLRIADLLKKKEGDNPHFWYNLEYVNRVVSQMESDLISLDSGKTDYYKQQYSTLLSSLGGYHGRIADIKHKYAGTQVASTESVFTYLADATGLDLISPPAFVNAVAEGNDPPAQSVVTFENQLKSRQVRVLVYNKQTVTPLTENIKKLAVDQGIPIVGVTETIQPPGASFQEWMNAELISLQNALNGKALGQ